MDKTVALKIEDILPDKHQPRKNFDEYELSLLSDSIRQNGIIEPLLVRPENGKFIIIAGERRYRASLLAGLKKLPCIIKKTDEITASLWTLTENLQRMDLSVFEEAEGIKYLHKEHNIPLEVISEKTGVTLNSLLKKLSILELSPPIRESILSARLSLRHALCLLLLEEDKRQPALEHIIAEALSAHEAEEYVKALIKKENPPLRKGIISDSRLYSNSLDKLLYKMQSGGVKSEKKETDKSIEYTVIINKLL